MKIRNFGNRTIQLKFMKFPKIKHVANSLLRPNLWKNVKQRSYQNGFQKALLTLAELDNTK